MLRGWFITGTDTNVGKTVAAAAFMHRYRSDVSVRYWKPVQTGIEQDDDTATVRRLGDCKDSELCTDGIRLHHPVSPHIAAAISRTHIDVSKLADVIRPDPDPCHWIVEGAGGVLVPLNESEFMVDLMARLALPVVVVARTALGTINHTLLTLEALQRRALQVAGIVLVGEADSNARDARQAIEKYGHALVLGTMPRFEELTSQTLRQWAVTELDREGRILNQ